MESAVRIRTTILPGKRIEITSPDLPDEGQVDVIVLVPEGNGASTGILDYLDSLPARERPAEYWAERDRQLREDRDSWDR